MDSRSSQLCCGGRWALPPQREFNALKQVFLKASDWREAGNQHVSPSKGLGGGGHGVQLTENKEDATGLLLITTTQGHAYHVTACVSSQRSFGTESNGLQGSYTAAHCCTFIFLELSPNCLLVSNSMSASGSCGERGPKHTPLCLTKGPCASCPLRGSPTSWKNHSTLCSRCGKTPMTGVPNNLEAPKKELGVENHFRIQQGPRVQVKCELLGTALDACLLPERCHSYIMRGLSFY